MNHMTKNSMILVIGYSLRFSHYSFLRNAIRVDISQTSTSCAGLKTDYDNLFSHSIG